MSKEHQLEQLAQDASNGLKKSFKNRIFDIIGVGLLIAMLALNLGVLELRDVTLSGVIVILLECIPFFLVAVLLSVNYYSKGVISGKSTDAYIDTVETYSDKIEKFTGKHIEVLPEFCDEYNDNALQKLQETILKRASITYDRFNNETYDEDDKVLLPLKVLSKDELSKLYSDERVEIILKAKKVHIKGLTVNMLLGNLNSPDTTDLGRTEKEMTQDRTKQYSITYLFTTLLMSIIGIRDILLWGWSGLLLVAFKLIYILCTSLMNHFKGYDDITVHLVNHIARKTDVLKQFEHWYDIKYNNSENINDDTIT